MLLRSAVGRSRPQAGLSPFVPKKPDGARLNIVESAKELAAAVVGVEVEYVRFRYSRGKLAAARDAAGRFHSYCRAEVTCGVDGLVAVAARPIR